MVTLVLSSRPTQSCYVCRLLRCTKKASAAKHGLYLTHRAPVIETVCTEYCDCGRRLTGRAMFRQQLISQRGHLIVIPTLVIQGTLEQLSLYLKPRLESASENTLDTYRLVQSHPPSFCNGSTHPGAADQPPENCRQRPECLHSSSSHSVSNGSTYSGVADQALKDCRQRPECLQTSSS